jgi:serine protease inhibitor
LNWRFAREHGSKVQKVSEGIISPSDRFAFKLFRELIRGRETSNVFFSPFSVMLCLLMVWEGASGETRDAMSCVLEIAAEDLEPSQQHLRILKVRQLLSSPLAIRDPGIELAVANSLWCDSQLQAQSAYLSDVKKHYAAEVFSIPFCQPQSVDRINSWIAQKTRGKITQILDSLDSQAMLVALNAIYFKGLWYEPFEKRLTSIKPFLAFGKQTVEVPLMHQSGEYAYYEERSFQAVRLPYRGDRVAMYVFLPAKDSSLLEFLATVTPALWDRWLTSLEATKGTVALPRFKFGFGLELKTILGKLGMAQAFTPETACFDRIAPPPPRIWLASVSHRALVEVNEEGTEAVAYTAAEGVALGRRPPPPFTMIVDRPFFFVICDSQSRSLLFMGAVNNPA